MNLKSESVEFDGIIFETTQFPAMRAYGLLARLVKVIGPAMSVLAGADKDTRLEDMGPVLGGALANVTPAEAQSLLLEIFGSSTAQVTDQTGPRILQLGTQAGVDQVFTGRLKVMFKVLAHALKVNFGDFSEGSDQEDQAAPVTTSPQAS